jgi:hypothetical protein
MTFITSEFKRSVGAPIGNVNRVVQDSLRGAGFQINSQSVTMIAASRGSKVAMAMLGGFALKKIPVVASVHLEPADPGCYLAVKLADDWSVLYGQASAAAKRYGEVFADVQQAIDAALWQLTPVVRADGAHQWSNRRHGAFMTKVAEGMEKFANQAAAEGRAVLTGDWRKAKRPWDDVEQVRFESCSGTAVLSILDVQAMLDAGTLIATRAGSLEPDLLDEAVRLQARVERALSGRRGVAIVPLRNADMPVIQFLRQQASLRNRLPVRTLQVCTECHARGLINPDYQKILTRNRVLRSIGGGVGAAISKGRITPFVLVGRVMSFAKLDPEFVCRSCQGMSADESIVAVCGECGAMQPQAVLKTCLKCKYDFRRSLPPERLWSDRENGAARPPLGTAAKWLPDPTRRHDLRYWNGHDWTAHVADDGKATSDPVTPPSTVLTAAASPSPTTPPTTW